MDFADLLKRAHRRSFRRFLLPVYEYANEVIQNGLGVGNNVHILRSGEVAFLRRYLRNKSHCQVVDAGARLGHYSLAVTRICPTAKILAIEPNPKAFEILRRRTCEIDADLVCQAVGDREQRVTFYDELRESGSAWCSLYPINIPKGSPVSTFEADVRTLDAILSEKHIERVELLKL
ncbi:MAG: FkbM family methyltransferase, partial [Bdellovibrionales bacterium]|nr:FkbM family methyltransferase [Bdellovibrionales bacterium]